ncbi:MAG TPA: peptidase [Alteromonas sp.]|nr:peptidase [Alteromonadaceae bacterium]MEC7469724.1 S24 family peptidase [Pseudomonadota bacterium]BBO25879.1 DNA polymerase V [Alteromonas sp. I4]HBY38050.1 peptidase [Alteromonas sp.]MAX41094.1 peptidase [Alteromonadaceae bacterium]|tara:strand:- start:811 stop:1227 length:417 start_codon:yes stop_codon:yes gene_type:complete
MLQIIPVAAQAGISGFESPAAEYKQLALDLDELLIEHPNATFIGQAKGDSMTGVGIFDGDLLIVDRAAAATSLDVIVANLNGSFVCKLYDRKSQVLLSPGLDHQPYALGEGDIFEIEGIVVRSVRMHRYVRWLSQCMR